MDREDPLDIIGDEWCKSKMEIKRCKDPGDKLVRITLEIVR